MLARVGALAIQLSAETVRAAHACATQAPNWSQGSHALKSVLADTLGNQDSALNSALPGLWIESTMAASSSAVTLMATLMEQPEELQNQSEYM